MAFTKKTPCPVSRETFRAQARPISIIIVDGAGKQHPFPLVVKEFSTGSLGWNFSGKIDVPVGSAECHCQVGVNITIANSKDLPQTSAPVAQAS